MKYLLPICLLFLFACQEEPPISPQEVVLQWQEHMDKNEFEKARVLSTPNSKEIISDIEELLKMDNEPIPVDTTKFISMACTEEDDTLAICRYTVEIDPDFLEFEEMLTDGNGVIADSFLLKKINGNWLVDIPEDPMENDELLEEMFEQLMNEQE